MSCEACMQIGHSSNISQPHDEVWIGKSTQDFAHQDTSYSYKYTALGFDSLYDHMGMAR